MKIISTKMLNNNTPSKRGLEYALYCEHITWELQLMTAWKH